MNFKTAIGLLTCLALLLINPHLHAQKSFEYGIGFGLNYTNLFETNNDLPETKSEFKGRLSPSIMIRMEYNALSRLRFTIDPSILFTQAEQEFDNITMEGIYISTPIKTHYRLFNSIWSSAGFSYDYLVNLEAKNEFVSASYKDLADNRHLISWQVGLNYDIKNWVEIALNYSQNSNSLYSLYHTGGTGSIISSGEIKNRYLQFSVIVSH